MGEHRVLVTGFEPFGNHSTNISQDVAQALEGHHLHPSPFNGHSVAMQIVSRVLTVDERGATEVAERLLGGEQWDAVIHLGLCESCEVARLEIRGTDVLSMRIPDNAGRQVLEAMVTGRGSQGAVVDPTTWPLEQVSMPLKVSYDAGTYICNETFHRSLLALQTVHTGAGLPTPCLFVHLPPANALAELQTAKGVLDIVAGLLGRQPAVDVVAGVVPSGDGRFLIAQRRKEAAHGQTWEFPGGKIEPGESWKDAIVREWREELDLTVKPLHLLGTRTHVDKGRQYNVHAVLCRPLSMTKISMNDHQDWAWWSPDEPTGRQWTGRDDELASELC